MAEAKKAATDAVEEQTNGASEPNGGTGRAALRAAAIAAASGATAIAAKKALSSRSESDEGDDEAKGKRKQSGSGDVLATALSTGWDSARDSVVPMLGNAAVQAGEYVARNSPELVRDTIVPQFIRGFQSARKNADDDDADE
jgi:hypothetical protein